MRFRDLRGADPSRDELDQRLGLNLRGLAWSAAERVATALIVVVSVIAFGVIAMATLACAAPVLAVGIPVVAAFCRGRWS